MANMTPEEFMEKYNPPVGKYDELYEAYQTYVEEVVSEAVLEGRELSTDLLNGELAFDTFMIKVWKRGQEK